MKAIRVREFGGPEVMRLEEVPDLHPGPGQVVVRVKAAGVNPVDTYIRSGMYARLPALPYTPGIDAAGLVESVGAPVAGEGVVCPGCSSECRLRHGVLRSLSARRGQPGGDRSSPRCKRRCGRGCG